MQPRLKSHRIRAVKSTSHVWNTSLHTHGKHEQNKHLAHHLMYILTSKRKRSRLYNTESYYRTTFVCVFKKLQDERRKTKSLVDESTPLHTLTHTCSTCTDNSIRSVQPPAGFTYCCRVFSHKGVQFHTHPDAHRSKKQRKENV